MSPAEDGSFQALIAQIQAAEDRGESVDPQSWIDQHGEHAAQLTEFFEQRRKSRQIDAPTMDSSPDGDATAHESRTSVDTPTLDADSSLSAPDTGRMEIDATPTSRQFADYELIEEIARGGMGVVFRARQTSLNRIVAVKMILAGQFAGEKDVQRFRAEAESAAQLEHPGIVPIFEIGEHDGQHFFSMSYVEGESLADSVANGPLSPRQAADLLCQICRAIAYAHERGVIHRDLKPANILLDSAGQPRITDFGLAKKTEADSNLTGTGQILGTPAYMPPEQAGGKADEIGPLADVYSLGAILYCMLTGRPPFQAANPMDALRQVLDKDPIPVRQLVPTVPRDLDTICGKCLNKDPAKRYASAAALADDLERFLDDQPIQARPAGRIERASKWASKQPLIAAILLTLPAWLLGEPKIGVGLLALVVGFHLPFRFRFVRMLTVFVMAVLVTAMAAILSYIFVSTEGNEEGRGARAAAVGLLLSSAPAAGLLLFFLLDCISELEAPARRRGRWLLLVSTVASLLCIGGFLYYVGSHSQEVSGIVTQLTLEIQSLTSEIQSDSEDARSTDQMMQLVRSRTVLWIPVYTAIVWLYLVLGIVGGRLIRRFVYVPSSIGKGRQRRRPAQWIKTVDGDVSRWVAIAAAVGMTILPYAVSKGLSVYDMRKMQAFEMDNSLGSLVWVLGAAWLGAFAVVSRRHFLIASMIGVAVLGFLSYWTVESIQQNESRLGPEAVEETEIPLDDSFVQEFESHSGPVKWVAVSRDGTLAASASGYPLGDRTVRVWEIESGELLWMHRTEELMMTVAFSGDGKRVLGGGRGGTVTIWDTETARQLAQFNTGGVLEAIRLFDDDRRLLTSGAGVKIWDLETLETIQQFGPIAKVQLDVALSADEKRVATGGFDQLVQVWDVETGDRIARISGLDANVESLTFKEDGSRLLIALSKIRTSDRPVLMSVSVDQPDDRTALRGHTQTVNWVRYSPDQSLLVTTSRDKTIRLWDAKTLTESRTIEGHQEWVWSAVFTPNGELLLSGGGGINGDNAGKDHKLRTWKVNP